MEISYQRVASLLQQQQGDLNYYNYYSGFPNPTDRRDHDVENLTVAHGNYGNSSKNAEGDDDDNDAKIGNIDHRVANNIASSSSRLMRNYTRNEIVVIPSLVSLSDDFFISDPPPAAATASSSSARRATAGRRGGRQSWNQSITQQKNDEEINEELVQQEQEGQERRSMEQNQHRHREHHPSVTLRPRPAAAAVSTNSIDRLNITIGHHTSLYNEFQYDNNHDDPPPEDWPVGPQGAPIPSHLLLQHHYYSDSHHHDCHHHGSFQEKDTSAEGSEPNIREDMLSNTAFQRSPPIAVAAVASAAASTSDMDSMPSISLPLLPSTLSSPPSPPLPPSFGRQQRPNDGGWREQRVHHPQHGRQYSRQQQQTSSSSTPSAVYINAVKFLDHAVTRLENKLSSTQTSSSSSSSSGSGRSNANNTPNLKQQQIEELESNLLIRLVEIMLHPPTATMCTPTTVVSEDNDSSNCCEYNEFDWSSHEEAGDDESRASDNHDDDDDELDDDVEEKDIMLMEGSSSSSGEINSRESRTNLTIPASHSVFSPNNSTQALPPLNQQHHYPTIGLAKLAIEQLGKMIPQRRVCQYAFKRNDIVWVCRTCQSDETCVLCHECFRNSNHDGHDVAFYHAQAGGCCDCGDEDAWSPKGFCGRHGGPSTTLKNCLGDDEVENPTKLMLNDVEPAVLGAVRAIADYLAVVVRSGVEGGYRRANPTSLLFHGATSPASPFGANTPATLEDTIPPHTTAPRGISNDDNLLPEYYDEVDGGRDRRHRRDFRRNTVADTETVQVAPLPMLHEAQFNPLLASTSSSASQLRSLNQSSIEVDMIDNPTFNKVFDPNAAGSSSSSSSSSKAASMTSNSGASKMAFDYADLAVGNNTQYKTSNVRSPARALGDLGREEHGLFLVLHCDEIHMGPPSSSSSHHYSSNSRSEVIAALKELYSAPGGGGRLGDAATGVTTGINHFTDQGVDGGGGGVGGMHTFLTTNRFIRQPDRLLLSPTRYSLFRAPQAEAILDRIVQIVKSQGDLIVWGTQEILAECGMLTSGFN